jgi:UDP-2-acetamido-2-deoxy-ribo-hexuluronate aminotransferase
MQPIQMVDTKTQYLKIKEEVDFGIQQVLNSAQYIGGKIVNDFATDLALYNGSKHCITCANGTDALQIAMMALNLQPGDEVITPSFTYIATCEVVALLKLKVVFAEVDPKTYCIDPKSVEQLITPKTKAIVPVHLYGHAAPMEEILQIAAKHNLYVIEDNAQAIGATYTFSDGKTAKTGSMGTIGCTSFYPSKNLGAYGDGGAIFTNDDELALKLKMVANHGQQTRYKHDVVGCNSRLDAIQAAILNVKLKHLDEYSVARQTVAKKYNEAFENHPKIKIPFVATYSNHVYHQYTLQLEGVDREALQAYLASKNIPSMIYYPIPAHKQEMFTALGEVYADMEATDFLTARVISLPIHTEMDDEQQEYIINEVLSFVNQQS